MMRTIALIAPTSGLLGQTEEEYAYIDGWLAFIWSSIDLPLQVLAGGANEAIQKDLDLALAKLEMHLQHKEFMVGQTITLADISLAVSLQGAREVTKPKEKSNLSRWYQNTISLPFFSPNPQPAASIK